MTEPNERDIEIAASYHKPGGPVLSEIIADYRVEILQSAAERGVQNMFPNGKGGIAMNNYTSNNTSANFTITRTDRFVTISRQRKLAGFMCFIRALFCLFEKETTLKNPEVVACVWRGER